MGVDRVSTCNRSLFGLGSHALFEFLLHRLELCLQGADGRLLRLQCLVHGGESSRIASSDNASASAAAAVVRADSPDVAPCFPAASCALSLAICVSASLANSPCRALTLALQHRMRDDIPAVAGKLGFRVALVNLRRFACRRAWLLGAGCLGCCCHCFCGHCCFG
ncbi:hypothetical protein FHX61_003894 [Cupriavidus alkaliphilus]|uniref:Uncharacterized protein n=1 Tax=Cupriavidus alkaliphilus TaxID=942866 RepID=A0A7W4VCU0_9BURK|nr:hypothetical protein [Cupriavidus alkaliphilus]